MNKVIIGIVSKHFLKNYKCLENHKSEENYVHEINIKTTSIFYNIVGKEKIIVNSRHKGYISDCGPLEPTAYSSDDIIEVVEDKLKKFYLAVQFHPETLYKFDENMNKIFKYFINDCLVDKNN